MIVLIWARDESVEDDGLPGIETADVFSDPEDGNDAVDMVEVVCLAVLDTEAADRGGLRAVAGCKFDGAKKQQARRKRAVVGIDRRRNMKQRVFGCVFAVLCVVLCCDGVWSVLDRCKIVTEK